MTNYQMFLATYLRHMQAEMEAHPSRFGFRIDRSPQIAARIVEGLGENPFKCHLSDNMKAAAKELGIPPTLKDIHAYLKA